MESNRICVIVPVLNERQNLPKLLEQLGHFSFEQLIIVDGGSTDDSWQWLQEFKASYVKADLGIICSNSGRAIQMNAGAKIATSDILLFLHADTELPSNATEKISSGMTDADWGRFDVTFKEPDWRMSVIAWFINWRSRITGVATGDQAIFVRRQIFEKMQGYVDIPLMEDVELSKRLLKESKPACLRSKVRTSARRWLQHGVMRTVILMWRLRWEFFVGVSPEKIAKKYRDVR